MQGYRSLTTAVAGGVYVGALIPCPTQGLTGQGPALSLRGGEGLTGLGPDLPLRGEKLRVPASPGHVRLLYPYPPSRRRRR